MIRRTLPGALFAPERDGPHSQADGGGAIG